MILKELFIKGINMLDALEQYYVNYNELQQIKFQYELEPQTRFRQMHEILKNTTLSILPGQHSLARGKGDR